MVILRQTASKFHARSVYPVASKLRVTRAGIYTCFTPS